MAVFKTWRFKNYLGPSSIVNFSLSLSFTFTLSPLFVNLEPSMNTSCFKCKLMLEDIWRHLVHLGILTQCHISIYSPYTGHKQHTQEMITTKYNFVNKLMYWLAYWSLSEVFFTIAWATQRQLHHQKAYPSIGDDSEILHP